MREFGKKSSLIAANGFDPLPVVHAQKNPRLDNWTGYKFDPADAKKYATDSVGIITANTPAVDIDVRHEAAAAEIDAMVVAELGAAPKRIGAAPKLLRLYRLDGPPFQKIATRPFKLPGDLPGDKAHGVEILAAGQQVVAFGIHPGTRKPYAWNGSGDPTTVRREDLPPITSESAARVIALAEAILAKYGTPMGKLEAADGNREHKPNEKLAADDQKRLREALKYIKNDDLGYDDWVYIGLAIKGALGEDGEEDFHEWSAQSEKYDAAVTQKEWDGFRPNRIGAGTIFHLAKEAGYKRPAESADQSQLVIQCAAQIETRPIKWLVRDPAIALGKVTLVVGDPGASKSTATLGLAAAITSTEKFPWIGCAHGSVLILSAEDDAEDTIVPRLTAAGADLNNVHILRAVMDVDKDGRLRRRTFNLARDLESVEDVLLRTPGTVLVIIDSISAYMGGVDSHTNTSVREVLAPLADFAARTECAVVAVSHLNKNTGNGGNVLYRVTGSLAFAAAARAVWVAVKDDADDSADPRRLFLCAKNNLAREGNGFAYRVVDQGGQPVIQWETERVTVTATEAMSSAKNERDDECEGWLRERLASGGKLAAEMWEEAETRKFSRNRVLKAQKRLHIRIARVADRWQWALRAKEGEPGDTL